MGFSRNQSRTRPIIRIPTDGQSLDAELVIPSKATGLVIFAHGSGSGRLSPRNIMVAKRLQKSKLATLLVDLLTPSEDNSLAARFDIDLLTERMSIVTDWALHNKYLENLPVGYFGASTGAAAAIKAAVASDLTVRAIVLRGGRVDLAQDIADQLIIPTLLIVGERDPGVLRMNELAFLKLECIKELAIIPNATHLFEEPNALESAAALASEWFSRYLHE